MGYSPRGHKESDTTERLHTHFTQRIIGAKCSSCRVRGRKTNLVIDMKSSVQFSRSVASDSLRPHESQHTRPPCPSPTPRVHPNSCALSQWCHPAISSSALSKTSLNIWKFMVHVLLKPGLENFEHYFTSMWDECNCVVVWVFFGSAFLWDWNKNWPFPVLWPLLSFPNLLAYWGQHFHSIIFQDLK